MGLRAALHACQIHPRRILRALLRFPKYWRDYWRYRRLSTGHSEWPVGANYPCLEDCGAAGGDTAGHYFRQDLVIAQRIFERSPSLHFDVGSRVDGFVAHVASFRPITYFDIRPLHIEVHNISFRSGDLMVPETMPAAACDSLSCLHVIEHVGLGRYGDKLDPNGWMLAMQTLARMLVPEGRLYLSVPIGVQRIAFNAHRIFRPRTVVDHAQRLGLQLDDFSWIDDEGRFLEQARATPIQIPDISGLSYGCGLFEFRRVVTGPSAANEAGA
jgi:hypothetical protein